MGELFSLLEGLITSLTDRLGIISAKRSSSTREEDDGEGDSCPVGDLQV